MMNKIVSELKKRFKANTNSNLTLTKQGDVKIRVESSSRVRCWATARCLYSIGNMGDVLDVLDPSREELEKNFKDFLDQGAWGSGPVNKNQKSPKS